MAAKRKNGLKVKIVIVIAAVGFVFLLNDRDVFSGLWLSPANIEKHKATINADIKEIKDDIADNKLLLYELKARVEMIQTSLYRVEDKLGTERTRRRSAISKTE